MESVFEYVLEGPAIATGAQTTPVTRWTPIVFILDAYSGDLIISLEIGSSRWIIYDGEWMAMFADSSSLEVLGDGRTVVTVLPNGGWWTDQLKFTLYSTSQIDSFVPSSTLGKQSLVRREIVMASDHLALVVYDDGSIKHLVYDSGRDVKAQWSVFWDERSIDVTSETETEKTHVIASLPNGGWQTVNFELRYYDATELPVLE